MCFLFYFCIVFENLNQLTQQQCLEFRLSVCPSNRRWVVFAKSVGKQYLFDFITIFNIYFTVWGLDQSFQAAVLLQVLVREENPGILYRFNPPVNRDPLSSYAWHYTSWSRCSALCAGGDSFLSYSFSVCFYWHILQSFTRESGIERFSSKKRCGVHIHSDY